MTDEADLLAPFDDEAIERVAGKHDVTADELRELLRRHQRQARENPGVEDIVYEWRSQFHGDPLLHRTEEAYYLRLRDHVWDEFADALDIPETALFALLDVHADQTRRDTGAGTRDGEQLMILGRE
ncbi:hypothetical protein [Halorientalis litorea]|uniref:hypothetical protein n=1 Tax=Halorientalis litorea TaxID=2931977 RepID=UPI001FF4BE00|nr:hypothetical protein [Halorientalis litorea]